MLNSATPLGTTADYRPSGGISITRLIPLALLVFAVAGAMAFVLYLAESKFYFYFITSLILSAPVFGAVFLAMHFGCCRSSLIGGVIGLASLLGYYMGYWEISYHRNIVSHGPVAVALMEVIAGRSGLLGYVVYRSKLSKPVEHPGIGEDRPPTKADEVFNYFFFGGEFLMLGILGTMVGWRLTRRVFYEGQGQWASTHQFLVRPADLSAALDALRYEDWPRLAGLPKAPARLGNTDRSGILFKFEYLPGLQNEPVYVTVRSGKGKLGRELTQEFGSRRTLWHQRQLNMDSSLRLAQAFARELNMPDLPIAPPRLSSPFESRAAAAPGAGLASIRTAVQSAGILPRKLGGDDFRSGAVAASEDLLAQEPGTPPGELGASLCLPAEPDNRRSLFWTCYAELMSLGLCLILLVGGAVLGILTAPPESAPGSGSEELTPGMIVGITGMALGAFLFIVYLAAGQRLLARRLRRRLGARAGAIVTDGTQGETWHVSIEEARTFHVAKTVPDDTGVMLLDKNNHRLLIEGILYRYLIRGEDILRLEPLVSGEKTVISIEYAVADQRLDLAIARSSLKGQLAHHFWWLSAKKDAARFVQKLREAVQLETS